jgi:hypothetical protein
VDPFHDDPFHDEPFHDDPFTAAGLVASVTNHTWRSRMLHQIRSVDDSPVA